MKQRSPIDLFLHKDKIALLWFFVAVSVTIGFWWERQRLAHIMASKPRFFVMDAHNTYYLPAALDFEEAKEIHAAQTRLAMEAAFQRSPNGVDNPERLKRLYGRDAYKQVIKAIDKDAAEFREKLMHQKVEFGPIQVLQVRDQSVLTGVQGQLIRNGVFRGKSFTEVLEVKGQFKFILNSDMTHNGRFPTVVVAFEWQTKVLGKA